MVDPLSLRASIALAAYSEPLIEGRRAVVFGDSSSRLAEHLLERGARLVHVYDPDPTRVAEAAARNTSRNISYASLGEGGAAVRDGAFDLAVVENLAAMADPEALIERVRRALSPRGAALIASPNPDMRVQLLPGLEQTAGSIDYYGLYDAVAETFAQVRMLGQTPFVGYAVVDFAADGEPEPALDSGFVPGGAEEPEWFIALASQQPVELDEFAVIQLPFLVAVGAGKGRKLEEELRAARAAERHARERMAELEADRDRLLEAERTRPPDRAAEVERLRGELERRDARIAQLEARATTADARAGEAQVELERERARAAQAEQQIERRDARIVELTRAEPADPVTEVDHLEAQLLERGKQVLRLERELRGAERVGHELVAELELLRAGAAGGVGTHAGQPAAREVELERKLDSLAQLNARLEADMETARWSIARLEGCVADVGLDTEQRAQLESDLQRTRTEVHKLATLIAQLRARAGAGEAAAR